MVKQIARSGLVDWFVQRCTAVIIGIYVVFLVAYLASHSVINYALWSDLFDNLWMRFATVLVTVSILWHAWIGLWTVFTDYVKNIVVRRLLEILVILLLLTYLVWVLETLWR